LGFHFAANITAPQGTPSVPTWQTHGSIGAGLDDLSPMLKTKMAAKHNHNE